MLEILSPAGNEECAKAAISSGANAIYLGFSAFSARANADNFDLEKLKRTVEHAHFSGVKVYIAMNTLVKRSELDEFLQTLASVWNVGVDAIILQDELLGKYVHEHNPSVTLHLSTQAGVCNVHGAIAAKACGFSRVILARETPVSEIRKIAAIIETEVFVQGALCTAFSGQCFFSSFVGGNSGNRGRCKQPCRKKYAWNRTGYEEEAYALSLSDLCVGEDIAALIEAGVTSFKIEGRMRRPEYVAAATAYYKSLLAGASAELSSKLSDLKRTYNRGNYTKGLAFGQDKRFLSRKIQGHLGEKVGVVKVIAGKYVVESAQTRKKGDAFKILRKGEEIGGAFFEQAQKHGFILSSKTRLLNGDDVFITTDAEVNERVLSQTEKKTLRIALRFVEGEQAIAQADGVRVTSEEILPPAEARPLTEEELKACFLKTDGLPLDIVFEKTELGRVFLPKSRLNAFRRSFFEAYYNARQCEKRNVSFAPVRFTGDENTTKNKKTALIATDFSTVKAPIDVAILKPNDYNEPLPASFLQGRFEKYICYPPFLSSEEEETIAALIRENDLDGVYAENYGGTAFARKHGFSLFAGVGFNLTNPIAAIELQKNERLSHFVLSKELSAREQAELSFGRAFVLESGNLKLMDLCYCPFEKSCARCDKKTVYTLKDENGRMFPVRRYKINGNCRFEVYNCADLIGGKAENCGRLVDASLCEDAGEAVCADTDEKQKKLYSRYTSGHSKNSVL